MSKQSYFFHFNSDVVSRFLLLVDEQVQGLFILEVIRQACREVSVRTGMPIFDHMKLMQGDLTYDSTADTIINDDFHSEDAEDLLLVKQSEAVNGIIGALQDQYIGYEDSEENDLIVTETDYELTDLMNEMVDVLISTDDFMHTYSYIEPTLENDFVWRLDERSGLCTILM